MKTTRCEDLLDNISGQVEEIRYELPDIEESAIADVIRGCCAEIDNLVNELRDEDCSDLSDMIPENMSLGDEMSLRDTINTWRKEHGYGEIS
jgi:hypothetical protein